ncbi:hypothetical protein D1646_09115 [Pseudoflavonifractor sp. 60]|nr:hypothetical protein [Pseudoflavonifractor sp. 60]
MIDSNQKEYFNMELKVDLPTLAGQNVDPATFQRVWDRVMPEQAAPAAREGGVIPDTAVPAQPSPAPSESPELPPVPDCPASEALPPVPDCPAEPTLPVVPDCPVQELVPDCPAGEALPPVPGCPAEPGTPTRPGCSACPALCLGEASQEDSGRLRELMGLAQTGAMTARALARRSNGPTAKAMSMLASDHRSAFRRLSAAYFLITGKRYAPNCTAPSLPASLPLALRQQFVWEQQWEQKNKQAAQATSDPCLRELYQELAQEGAYHAGVIRSILEQMA